jgi:hypothetical protein
VNVYRDCPAVCVLGSVIMFITVHNGGRADQYFFNDLFILNTFGSKMKSKRRGAINTKDFET